jgi:hypothetical protein
LHLVKHEFLHVAAATVPTAAQLDSLNYGSLLIFLVMRVLVEAQACTACDRGLHAPGRWQLYPQIQQAACTGGLMECVLFVTVAACVYVYARRTVCRL